MVDNYRETGPLGDSTAFQSEHLIGQIVKSIKSPNLTLQQVANNACLNFGEKLKSNSRICNSTKPIGKSFIFDDKTCFKAIMIGCKKFTSALYNKELNYTNHYVETKSKRFFKVLYYFKIDNSLFFDGQEIFIESKLSSKLANKPKLELEHILSAKLSHASECFNVDQILGKVLFSQKFRQGTDNFINDDKGFIIRTHFFKFHN